MVVYFTKPHFLYKGLVYYWSHIITKLILFLRQNSLFLHENLIILFEYPQSISGDDFLPNTCTIIACMKQHMHLLATRSTYDLGEGEKTKELTLSFKHLDPIYKELT